MAVTLPFCVSLPLINTVCQKPSLLPVNRAWIGIDIGVTSPDLKWPCILFQPQAMTHDWLKIVIEMSFILVRDELKVDLQQIMAREL